jgi:hypothetical protein
MNNAANVKRHDEHGLHWAVAHSRLLRSWRWWALPLRRLPLCLRVVPVDQRLVTGDDPGHEGLPAAHSERSWHTVTWCSFCSGVSSRGTNLAATRCMFNSDVKIVCTVPNDTPIISAMLLTILRRSACTGSWILPHYWGWCLWKVFQIARRLQGMFFPLWSTCATRNIVYDSLPHRRKLAEACSMSLWPIYPV